MPNQFVCVERNERHAGCYVDTCTNDDEWRVYEDGGGYYRVCTDHVGVAVALAFGDEGPLNKAEQGG